MKGFGCCFFLGFVVRLPGGLIYFMKRWVQRTAVPVRSELFNGRWPPADELLCTALVDTTVRVGLVRSPLTSSAVGCSVLLCFHLRLASYEGQSEVPALITTVMSISSLPR